MKRDVEYDSKNTIPTIKHRGGNIFLLRVQDNVTDLKTRILDENLLSAKTPKMGHGWVFRHDSDQMCQK